MINDSLMTTKGELRELLKKSFTMEILPLLGDNASGDNFNLESFPSLKQYRKSSISHLRRNLQSQKFQVDHKFNVNYWCFFRESIFWEVFFGVFRKIRIQLCLNISNPFSQKLSYNCDNEISSLWNNWKLDQLSQMDSGEQDFWTL